MWKSHPGLSCSRGVSRGQQGPHEEPKRREMLSVHLSPGEVRRAPWCIPGHRLHLHPGNGAGIASRGMEMVEMMVEMMEMPTGSPVPAGLP